MSQTELLILGATGATGRHVLQQAQDSGFKIHVLARDPSKLVGAATDLQIVQGDARDPEDLSQAMPSGGLVVTCLGIGPRGPKSFYSQTASAIVAAAKDRSPRQIVVLSTLGTGSTAYRRTPMLSGMFRLTGANWILEDRGQEEEIYKCSNQPVTVLQSCLLSNGKPRGRTMLLEPTEVPRLGFMGPMIARSDVANILLQIAQSPSEVPETKCLLPKP